MSEEQKKEPMTEMIQKALKDNNYLEGRMVRFNKSQEVFAGALKGLERTEQIRKSAAFKMKQILDAKCQ